LTNRTVPVDGFLFLGQRRQKMKRVPIQALSSSHKNRDKRRGDHKYPPSRDEGWDDFVFKGQLKSKEDPRGTYQSLRVAPGAGLGKGRGRRTPFQGERPPTLTGQGRSHQQPPPPFGCQGQAGFGTMQVGVRFQMKEGASHWTGGPPGTGLYIKATWFLCPGQLFC
jgi:hypothetical protein